MTETKAIILPDEPATEDKFHGGGHQRSADALAHAVVSLADVDGAIGLEGPWGSGKSTVIQLAEQNFSKSNGKSVKNKVFTFDLWLHNPDILKLAFIEEFIAWARREKLLSQAEHDKFSKDIADRKINTRLTNRREFSISGILFVLLFPLLPLIYTWLSPFAFNANRTASPVLLSGNEWQLTANELALYGLLAFYAIFFATVIFALFRGQQGGLRGALSTGARLFSRDTDFDEINQSIRERNSTSEEFQSTFREIISKAQKKGSRIVFVFDNIDRLPGRIVPKVWSECRSIFAMTSRGHQPPNSSVTAIVPYDASFIADAFGNDKDDPAVIREHADSLIRKTFKAIIRVAPPLSTDWKSLMEVKLDEAFPTALSDTQKYRLFKLFDIDHQERSALPTPRDIIAYVNEIATVWNQWGDKIDVSHIGLYVLKRRQLEASPEALKTTGYVSPRQSRVMGEDDVTRSIVALHYNVEPEHAYQVLLGQEIARKAISQNSDEFIALARVNGFKEVFPDVVLNRSEQWAREGGDYLATAANNMAAEEIAGDYLKEAWYHLSEATVSLDDADTSDPGAYSGLALIVANVREGEARACAKRLTEWFTRNLPDEDQRTSADGENWVQFYSAIRHRLAENIGTETSTDFVSATDLPKGANFTLGACAASAENKFKEFDAFRQQKGDPELSKKMCEAVKSDLDLLGKIIQEKPQFLTIKVRGELTAAICDRLHAEKVDGETLERLSSLLSSLRTQFPVDDNSKNPILTRANDGTLVFHILEARNHGKAGAVGELTWILVDATEGQEVPTNPGNHPHHGDLNSLYSDYGKFLDALEADGEEIGAISKLVSHANKFTSWQDYALEKGRRDFFKKVLRRLVDNGTYNRLDISKSISQFEAVCSVLGEELAHKHLKKITEWKMYFGKNFSGDEALGVPPFLFRKIHDFDVSGFEELKKCADDYFATLDKEQWLDVFRGSDERALGLLLVRIDTDKYRPPLEAYRDALNVYATDILDGKLQVSDRLDERPLLFSGIQKNSLGKLARDVLLNLKEVTTTRESVEHFLKICGPLAEVIPLEDQPDLTIDLLVAPLSSSEMDEAQEFLNRNRSKLRTCFSKSSETVRGRMEETLLSLHSEGENGREKAKNIADYVGAQLPLETSSEEEDESDPDSGKA